MKQTSPKWEPFEELAEEFAHNIRSPLSALQVVVDTDPGLSEENRKLLLAISKRLLESAESLLRGGRRAKERFSVGEMLEALMAEKRLEWGSQPRVQLELLCAEDAACEASVPRFELAAVVSNLINNAVEATAGPVQVVVWWERMENILRIGVQDNGPGIPPWLRERVVRGRFSYGKAGGKGVGLFHAAGFAQAMGGDLGIFSVEGGGTEVVLSLPL